MQEEDTLALDEARRLHRHSTVKGEFENRVNTEIRAGALIPNRGEGPKIDAISQRLRSSAIDDVADTEDEIQRQRSLARVRQFVDYAFGVVYGLLALRFLLGLIGARSGAGFVRLIDGLSGPLVAPFRGILPTQQVAPDQSFTFAPSLLVALVAYALLHFAIKGMLRLIGRRSTEL
jgi:hypothetical protein